MIKNQRASRYKRSWNNAANRVAMLDLEISLKIEELKNKKSGMDSDSILTKVMEIRRLKEKRCSAHTQCRKYKKEYLINNI
jgi:hypothetical protein